MSTTTNTTTGYKYTKRVNARLVSEGFKKIPAQMVYQYLSKGWIPFVDIDGQRLVDVDAAEAWLVKHVEKKIAKRDEGV